MYRDVTSVLITGLIVVSLLAATVDWLFERNGKDLVKDDSMVEEIVEDIIEDQLHFKIDLTPDTPEPESV